MPIVKSMKPDLNKTIPLLPLRNTVVYPGIALPVLIGRPASIHSVKASRQEFQNWIVVITQFDEGHPSAENLPKVGVLSELKMIEGSDEQGYHVLIQPVERVRVHEFHLSEESLNVLVDAYTDVHDVSAETEKALLKSLKQMADEILQLMPTETAQLRDLLKNINDLSLLTHLCSTHADLPLKEQQDLLELVSLKGRTLKLLEILSQKKDELQVRSEIRDRLSHKLGKGQREAILREQLKTIREELGETDDGAGQNGAYREKIDAAQMPEDAKKVALDELKRLEMLGSASPESHVIRNYLDLLCAMPWVKSSTMNFDSLNLNTAKNVLDEEHYGLEKIKKRILQQLAVMKLKKSTKGSILLFIGPPGVGKTSLGQSIAKALGRKFVRASLGGVRDDAEIRGHRRTYIGAMPGRIIQGIKRAGENNPVFMLDEIDKLGRGFSGDPAAALLEVLDPEQNSTFLDHYLDVAFDLSRVFFIATANSYEGIPGPLLDRMEVIELSSYTTTEKVRIAKTHLIPKVLQETGIPTERLQITDAALMKLITHYTRESGVRDLQRQIAAVARASAERVISSQEEPVVIDEIQLEDVLGPERFVHEVAESQVPPGVVTGLAWTPQGGDILFIESTLMPGKGQLMLTGQLGEVMKESAQIALSLVRSRLSTILPGFDFDKQDIHVHVPAGATPKDGPSAGVTMLTAIASIFSRRSVDPKLAMTGEITLRGTVTPVGGIKEKVMAAHRSGIKQILLCKRNEKDLKDIPAEVRSQMQFIFVERIEEVLRFALRIDLPDLLSIGKEAPFVYEARAI